MPRNEFAHFALPPRDAFVGQQAWANSYRNYILPIVNFPGLPNVPHRFIETIT